MHPPTTRPQRRSGAALMAGALLLVAGCGSPAADDAASGTGDRAGAEVTPGTGTDAGPPQLSAATTALRESLVGSTSVRYDAAAVQGATLQGETVVAADLDGPVVYWFWAPWCTVCRAEAPAVAEVAERWEGQVTFVGVASRGPQDHMEAFVAETGVGGFPHIADVDGTIWAQLGVSAQPAFVFVDREGSATGWLGGLGEPLLDDVAATLTG